MYNVGLVRNSRDRVWGVQRILNYREMVIVSPISDDSPLPPNEDITNGCYVVPIRPREDDITWYSPSKMEGATTKLQAVVFGQCL